MGRDYYVPSSVVLAPEKAHTVAYLLAQIAAALKLGSDDRNTIEEVSNALYAIGNDTDCIVTDASVLEGNDG
jgi:hypothetical protein